MDIKKGSVKYSAGNKTFQSKYSDKPQQNIVISMEDGTEEKIYFDQGRYPHAQLRKGDEVQIVYEIRDGRQTRKLVADIKPGTQSAQQPSYSAKPSSYQAPAASSKPAEPALSAKEYIKERVEIVSAIAEAVKSEAPEASAFLVSVMVQNILNAGYYAKVDFEELLEKEELAIDPVAPVVTSDEF